MPSYLRARTLLRPQKREARALPQSLHRGTVTSRVWLTLYFLRILIPHRYTSLNMTLATVPSHWALWIRCLSTTGWSFVCFYTDVCVLYQSEMYMSEMIQQEVYIYIWRSWFMTMGNGKSEICRPGWRPRNENSARVFMLWFQDFFFKKPKSLLLSPSTDWVMPTHTMEGILLYL